MGFIVAERSYRRRKSPEGHAERERSICFLRQRVNKRILRPSLSWAWPKDLRMTFRRKSERHRKKMQQCRHFHSPVG